MTGISMGTDAFVTLVIVLAASASLLFGAWRRSLDLSSFPVMTQRSRYGCVSVAVALYALAYGWSLARGLVAAAGNIGVAALIVLAVVACVAAVAWIYYNPAEAAYKPHWGQADYIMTADKRRGDDTLHQRIGDGINYQFAVKPALRK